jgi:hypothetical protein
MGSEPKPSRGQWLAPGGRNPSYPPRRQRFPGPRVTCDHCGLASETTSLSCPVCAAPFPNTRIRRAFAKLRRRR